MWIFGSILCNIRGAGALAHQLAHNGVRNNKTAHQIDRYVINRLIKSFRMHTKTRTARANGTFVRRSPRTPGLWRRHERKSRA